MPPPLTSPPPHLDMTTWRTFVRLSWLTVSLFAAIKKQASATVRNEIQVFHSVSLVKLAFKYKTDGIEFAIGVNLALRLSVLRFEMTLNVKLIMLNTM